MPKDRAAPPRLILCVFFALGFGLTARQEALAQAITPPPPDPSTGIALGPGILSPSANLNWHLTDNLFRENDIATVRRDTNGDGTADRLETVRNPRISSLVTEIIPRFSYLLPYSHSRLTVIYSPEYRDYSRVALSSKVAHNTRLQNTLVLSNGMQVEFASDYVRGIAESTEIDPAEQRSFSTTPFRQRRTSLAWRWNHPSHWGTVLTLDQAKARFLKAERNLPGPPSAPFFDYSRGGFFLDGTWQPRRELELYGGFGLHGTHQDRRKFNQFLLEHDEETLGQDSNGDGTVQGVEPGSLVDTDRLSEQTLRIGARGIFGRRANGTAEVGYTKIRSAVDRASGFRGLQLRVSSQVRLTQSSLLGVELTRQPVQALVDRSSLVVSNSARLSWSFSPGRVHSWGLGGRVLDSNYGLRRDRTLALDGSWSVRIHRLSQVRFVVAHAVRRSDLSVVKYAEDRISVAWLLGWL